MSLSIEELETWFAGRELPDKLYLNKAVKITDVASCVKNHIDIVKRYGVNSLTYAGFYERLLDIKLLIEVSA